MSSDWINHVKKYAKEHNIKYGEALKEASSTFNRSDTPAINSRKVKKSKKNRSRRNTTTRRRRRR